MRINGREAKLVTSPISVNRRRQAVAHVLNPARGLDGNPIDLANSEHVFILLDCSGSMAGSRTNNCLEMLDETLRYLRSIMSEKRPDVPFFVHIAMFNDKTSVCSDLQSVLIFDEYDIEAFVFKVKEVYRPSGRTAMYSAIDSQIRGLLMWKDNVTSTLDNVTCIVIGDGEDTVSDVPFAVMSAILEGFLLRAGSLIVLGVGSESESEKMVLLFDNLRNAVSPHHLASESYSDLAVACGDASRYIADSYRARFSDRNYSNRYDPENVD